jgi:hypothetical protein
MRYKECHKFYVSCVYVCYLLMAYVQGDQKVSVHLMIAIQKVTSYVHLSQSDCLAADRQGQEDTRLTLTPSVIHNSKYIIMVSD